MSKRRKSPPKAPVRAEGGLSIRATGDAVLAKMNTSDLWGGQEVELRALTFLVTKVGDRLVGMPDGSVQPMPGTASLPEGATAVIVTTPNRGVIGAYPRDMTLRSVHWEDSRDRMAELYKMDLRRRHHPVPSRPLTADERSRSLAVPLADHGDLAGKKCGWPECSLPAHDGCTGCDIPLCRDHSVPCEAEGAGFLSFGYCERCLVICGLLEP